MNGLSHPYQLDEFTFLLRGIRSDVSFLFHFLMTIMLANRIAPDGTPPFAASHLGLFCLPMSHKKDARPKVVKHVMNSADPQNHSEWRGRVRLRFLRQAQGNLQ